MQILLELDGKTYRGPANWSNSDGLTADLVTVDRPHLGAPIPDLPDILRARVDETQTVLLLRPYLTRAGGFAFGVGQPLSSSMTLNALAMVVDLPWDFDETTVVDSIRVSSSAMQLWRGDDNLKVEFKPKGKATYKTTSLSRKVVLGSMRIEQGIKLPSRPLLGSIQIRSQTSAKLNYGAPRSLLDCYLDIQVIEGYFDLLAAFPRRSVDAAVCFSGDTRPRPIRVALDQNEHALDPHPLRSFLRFHVFGVTGRSFDRYSANFAQHRLFQATLRFLSRPTQRFPEGFLTACNVIESLGQAAKSGTSDLAPSLDKMAKALAGEAELLEVFEKRIRPQIRFSPSFADRYRLMVDRLKVYGLDVDLKHRDVVKARGQYRHNITQLSSGDLKLMSATTSLAWIYGLIWLCCEIGIPAKAISEAAQANAFHSVRQTGLHNWGCVAQSQ